MQGFLDILSYPTFILTGILWTLLISVIAITGGSILGLIFALMRISSSKILQGIAAIYVDFFRTTPLLIQLMWFYYAFPLILDVSLNNILCAAIGMCLYAGAYITEVFRFGILDVPKGQTEAALAIGMKKWQVFYRVVLPQGIVKTLPPLTTTYVQMIKDSSICSIIGLPELIRQTNALGSFTLGRMEAMTVAGILYFFISFPLTRVIDKLHKKHI